MFSYKEQEDYYSKFWRTPLWGSDKPNEDERFRASAISELIENYILSSFESKRDLRILDLGCGRGWLTKVLADYGCVMGIDPLKASVMRAQELFPNIDFQIKTAEDLLSDGYSDNFHLIISSEVIEHVVDFQKKKYMESIFSLLSTNGFAILTTPCGEFWDAFQSRSSKKQPIEQWLTKYELKKLVRSVGLRVIKYKRIFLPCYNYGWLNRMLASKFFYLINYPVFIPKILTKIRYYHVVYYQVILVQKI